MSSNSKQILIAKALCKAYYDGWAMYAGDFIPSEESINKQVEDNWKDWMDKAKQLLKELAV